MTYTSRFGHQLPEVSGIDDWSPPQQPRKRCAECHCYLRQGNPGPFCSVCERVDIAKADARRVQEMEPTSRTIPSARMNVAPRTKAERVDMQLKAYKESGGLM